MNSVRVRFPPSPTGFCHVGTARMAIVNYLFARKNNGTIIFRSEDTDKERSTREFEDDIKDSLTWLGLSWDEFHRQSERIDVYRAEIEKLIDEDKAYVSDEESKKDPGTMVSVIRLRNSGKTITFTDVIRGDISFDTTELKDFVIARSKDDPLYHLAVVVDDAAMGITHVIRGEDHISNTPRQILIQEALGAKRPMYAHYPLHLSLDRAKLSKRKGDVAVKNYREKGYLPQALLNYLATLGWTAPSGREVLSLDEMVQEFELSDLHKSGAVFDVEKLRWFNREYMLKLSDSAFASEALSWLENSLTHLNWNESIAKKIIPLVRERISVWSDIHEQSMNGEYDYFFVQPSVEAHLIPMKKISAAKTAEHLRDIKTLLEALNVFDVSSIKDALWPYATKEGRGAVLWPFRYSLTGKEQSPDPFLVASILGKDETVRRVSKAIASLS
ncbi:MAG: nondiscriminating glutamyl-tRNA synthetase [Parcubacteria group bacterium Gr01-1014_8]|nr:MAG: nondiscriminating glutamyl-tRNA synthetase [Parcubacteria group bacterium Gr01-1014_8]